MFQKISTEELRTLVIEFQGTIDKNQLAEMAVPSYLHFNPLIRWLVWRRNQLIHAQVEKLQVRTVLDFGCGFGVLLPSLCKSCESVYAIDLEPAPATRLATMKCLNVRFLQNLEDAPDKEFDAVVAAEVLEHVEDVPGLISQMRPKLRPHASVIVSGPTENLFYKVGRLIAGFGAYGDYHHRNVDDILADFRVAGAEITLCNIIPSPVFPLFKVFTAAFGNN